MEEPPITRPDRSAGRGEPNLSPSSRGRSRVRRHEDAVMQAKLRELVQPLDARRRARSTGPEAGHKIA